MTDELSYCWASWGKDTQWVGCCCQVILKRLPFLFLLTSTTRAFHFPFHFSGYSSNFPNCEMSAKLIFCFVALALLAVEMTSFEFVDLVHSTKKCYQVCDHGACLYQSCDYPQCPGGACRFIKSTSPTCSGIWSELWLELANLTTLIASIVIKGGACIFEECKNATCDGGRYDRLAWNCNSVYFLYRQLLLQESFWYTSPRLLQRRQLQIERKGASWFSCLCFCLRFCLCWERKVLNTVPFVVL